MTNDEKRAIDADLADMLDYYTNREPRTDDQDTRGNTGFLLLMGMAIIALLLIGTVIR